jgi:hypothetical protein
VTEIATRAQAFGLIADGVAAGLSAPWRLYLARGCRISVELIEDVSTADLGRLLALPGEPAR